MKIIEQKLTSDFCSVPSFFRLIFLLDEAPPHWEKIVKEWLNLYLPHKWFGIGGVKATSNPWLHCLFDIIHMGFYLRGYIKELA